MRVEDYMLESQLRQLRDSAECRRRERDVRDDWKRWMCSFYSLELHSPARSIGGRVYEGDRDRVNLKHLLQLRPRLSDYQPLLMTHHVFHVAQKSGWEEQDKQNRLGRGESPS